MGFEYFYGDEAEQFSFYRIPKLLMTSPRFKRLSDSAKLLYGLMLDRMGLSVRNGWFDDKNRAYIYFTVNEIMSIMNCATEKATKIVAELDSAKGVGLIERIKQGQGKPAIIYLKRFVDTDEQSTLKIEKQEIYTEENKDFEKRNQGFLKNEKQGFGKSKCNNTDINNTEMSNINSIHQDVEKKERWIDRYTQTTNEIKEQIDYGYLISTNEKEIADEVVNIMADVMTVYRPKYKIEGVPVDNYGNKIKDGEQIQKMSLTELKPFEAQPFKVLMDESMEELVESIKDCGVLSPIVVRPHKDGGYEILSGHRRAKASELAGRETVPVIVRELDDDMATIFLVDSNLQRENILPSEKAYAYKLKLEAMKRKAGRPSKENGDQIGNNFLGVKSVDVIAQNSPDSRNQIQRYIRLTELIDPLLDLVDEKRLPLNAAVELSYLGTKAQADVMKSIEKNETIPSIEQSAKIRRFSNDGKVNEDVIDSIMQEEKPEKLRITLKEDKLRRYFPKSYTPKQIEDTIMKLIEHWARKRQEPER